MEKSPYFTVLVEIRFADTDANGHVFFGNYFTFFDTAFLKYLDHLDCSFDWFIESGLNFYYVEAGSQFKSALKYGDTMRIRVNAGKIGSTSFTLYFEGVDNSTLKPVASGHIVAVVVDRDSEQPVKIPDKFRQALICS